MNFSAVIIAGAKSSRTGQAFLEIDGEMLLARKIKIVRDAGAHEIFISGRAEINRYRQRDVSFCDSNTPTFSG